MSDVLLIERHAAVALVQFNRPEAMNAFDDEIRRGLPNLLAELDADPEVRAIVLTGAGEKAFCAGADIKEARARPSAIGERKKLMPTSWIESLDRVAKPLIAAIHGICLGGGLEIAMACDIRVAAANAKLGLTETALGLIPGGGGTQRLPRLIGMSRALDMLLTAERIDAAESYRIGLVTRLAETRDEAVAEAMRIAALLASRPPAAIAYCKEAAITGAATSLSIGLSIEKSLFALLTTTADRAEAANAFAEKRVPRFTGE
ncbi:MAG: enoyl-CoA hydratase [Novosphingobium sp.]|nr:enoyl-CoA hydratase [Novosphingobium sp.]